jgi:trimeric autotransporter adhesin
MRPVEDVTVHQLSRFVLALICAPFCAAAVAQVTACVDTVEEFDAAFEQAEDEPVEIRVVRGTYTMSGSCISRADNKFRCQNIDEAITIRGGYAPGCGSRTRDASDTVFNANLSRLRISTRANVRLESLRFFNGGEFEIEIESNTSPDARLTLSRVWFDRMGQLRFDRGAEIAISNALFTRTHQDCAIAIGTSINTTQESLVELAELSHVTVARPSGTALCIGQTALSGPGDIRMRLYNSIFWSADGGDMVKLRQIGTIDAILRNNIYNALSVVPDLTQSPIQSQTSDPQFAAPNASTPALANYELQAASPGINSGQILLNTPNDFDVEGAARQFSTAPDRGALESAIGSNATTINVVNTNDSGVGSLRQALTDANATAGFTRIHFNIPGACPRVINVQTQLPTITQALKIDGYTQPGASRNTLPLGNDAELCVILNAPQGSTAFTALETGSTLPAGATLAIDGLGFSGFLLGGVGFTVGNNHSLTGSAIGGTINGYITRQNGFGVRIGAAARQIAIGGSEPAERNVIGGVDLSAIDAQGREHVIENNFLGTSATGGSAAANGRGVLLRNGGNSRVIGNVISANLDHGIEIDGAEFNVISGNRIGTSAICVFGPCDLGNGEHGVFIHGTAARGNSVSGNRIVYNNADGVAISNGAAGNVLTSNVMFDNTGLGIDLGTTGLNPIDSDYAAPPASAGNRNQNTVQLTSAVGNASSMLVRGSLNSRNGTYRINFYADDECPLPIFNDTGQGRVPLSSTIVTVSGGSAGAQVNGEGVLYNVPVFKSGDRDFFATPRQILATATRLPDNDTSEFSRCVTARNELIFFNGFE